MKACTGLGNGEPVLRKKEIKGGKTRKTEGSDHVSTGKDCTTRGLSEKEGGTCGGSDLHCDRHILRKKDGHEACLVPLGEGLATWVCLHRPAGNEEIEEDRVFGCKVPDLLR